MRHNIDIGKFVCLNKECSKYNKENIDGHIVFSHMDGKNKNIAYLKCTICGQRFSENKGTIFYRKKKSRDTISQVLTATSEGMGIRPAARTFGVNKNTILSWVKQGGEQSEKLEKKSFS